MTPQGHLRASLRLLNVIEQLGGGHPKAPAVRRLLNRPKSLPEKVPATDSLLKYDAYLACGKRRGWGITINDRWESATFATRVDELAADLGYDLAPYHALRQRLEKAAPALTVSLGFAAANTPPRLKLYLQEDRWNEGVCSAAELRAALANTTAELRLPAWLAPERRIGVVTVTLGGEGCPSNLSIKAYVGGEDAVTAAAGAPPEATELARAMHAACPLTPAFYYLTIRLAPAAAARYAINKIYNPVAVLVARDRSLARDQWQDVEALFARSGRSEALLQLRQALGGVDNGWLLPTATALEDGSRSADVYCAAWEA